MIPVGRGVVGKGFFMRILFFLFAFMVLAAEGEALSDGVDRSDPNFVKASLVSDAIGEVISEED